MRLSCVFFEGGAHTPSARFAGASPIEGEADASPARPMLASKSDARPLPLNGGAVARKRD